MVYFSLINHTRQTVEYLATLAILRQTFFSKNNTYFVALHLDLMRSEHNGVNMNETYLD